MKEAAPAIAWGVICQSPLTGQYRARTDEGDGHEGDPQPSVKPDDPFLAVNEQGNPRDGNRSFRGLQPRLEGVQLPYIELMRNLAVFEKGRLRRTGYPANVEM